MRDANGISNPLSTKRRSHDQVSWESRRGYRMPIAILRLLAIAALFFCPLGAWPARAQSCINLYAFTHDDTADAPYAGLIADSAGNLYGTATSGDGSVFKLDAANNYAFSTLHLFNGALPYAGLFADAAGNLYGATFLGGAWGYGTVFKLDAGNNYAFTTLHSFHFDDGAYPGSGLTADSAGNLYGTTVGGGTSGYGTVFKLDVGNNNSFSTLYNFAPNADGDHPTGVITDSAGNIYGALAGQSDSRSGTIYKLDAAHNYALTTLHTFAYSDGASPHAVIMDSAGNLYGTTWLGGANEFGTVFKLDAGNNYALTTLHDFASGEGTNPFAPPIADSAGNLYGTTEGGGASGHGTVFKLEADNNYALTTLHDFAGGSEGSEPLGALLADSAGNLYGTTWHGGAGDRLFGGGVVFRLMVKATVSGTTTICKGSSATIQAALAGTGPFSLTWSDGFVQSGVTAGPAVRTVSPNFTTTYTVTAVSDADCTGISSGSAVVTVETAPKATVSGDATICAGSSTVIQAALTGAPPWNLIWSDGFTQAVSSSPATRSVSPATQTTYSVTAVSDAACGAGNSSGTATVKVNPLPSAVITAPASVCANSTGNTASVPNAGSGATYSWAITNGTITSGAGTRTIKFTAGPSGSVGLAVVVTKAGCSSTGSASPAVNPLSSAVITAPPFVCRNSTGNIASVPDAGAGATYAWTIMNGTITSGAGTRAITFSAGNKNVTLNVTVTNSSGCSSSSSTVVPLNSGC
jgi:uncharacterized repeat protein (TIGR03803 family)